MSKIEDAFAEARSLGLYRPTPLIHSESLSSLFPSNDVYLKLDCLQPSGSFKDRGMSYMMNHLFRQQGIRNFISSSGGNAGLAVATVGNRLKELHEDTPTSITVVVPQTTQPLVIDKLKSKHAHVIVHGKDWNAADQLARKMVDDSNGTAYYMSPYDHPLLWTGHSSLVDEVVQDLDKTEAAAMIVSVGGGGLLCGVLEGWDRVQKGSPAIVAAETVGAASFGKAFQQGQLVRLEAIESVATSLGALEVTPVTLERSKKYAGTVRSAQCTDAEAVQACLEFAKDHRILVEPACGAALAVLYSERLRNEVLSDIEPNKPIVVEVCGGSGVNLDLMEKWKNQFSL